MKYIRFGPTLATVERDYILDMLAQCDGNRTLAAKLLSVSLRCLRIKLHEYAESGIEVPLPHKGASRSEQRHHSGLHP